MFAYPSIPLLREQLEAFRGEADLPVMEAHSEAPGGGSVQNRLERHQLYLEANGIEHAVVLITHEGMMGADLSSFGDWHVRIDEAPNTIQSGVVNAPASADLLKGLFAITPMGTQGWGQLRLLNQQHGWRARSNDDLFKPLEEMMKQGARKHGVFVDTLNWKDRFGWCSIWPVKSLAQCKSVKVAGASYSISLGAIVSERWEGVAFKTTPMVGPRLKQADVRVHYFTQSHEGNTAFWKKPKGNRFIGKLGDFLASHEPHLGFWAANDAVKPLLISRLNGKPISAKSAGLNKYDEETSCTLIYSSKALPGDKPAKELFAITDAEIFRAREEEDILQFVMRGAIRRRDFDGEYDIYLYSKRQAELVAEKLVASGIGRSVELVPEPGAGIMDADPDPLKDIRTALVADKQDAKRDDYKEREAARKKKDRADVALAEGRESSANEGRGGRPPGSKDRVPRKGRAR